VTDEPEITIVIPTHDRWPLLCTHGLPSALGQEDVSFEVIVVDDGSTDETQARLTGISDSRLRVIRNERPRKLAAARNAGIAAARGRWLAFLDDDDLWSPHKLRRQLDTAAAAGAGWVYAGAIAVDERKVVLELDSLPRPEDAERLLLTGNHIPGGGSNVIARTELVRRLGAFDEELLFFTDWDLWLRLARVARPAVCDDILVARLVHSENMLFREGPNVMPSFVRLLGKHRPVTAKDRQAIAEWVANRYHRAGHRYRAAYQYLRVAVVFRSPGNLPPAFGAMFGERGMEFASHVLLKSRGVSHLEDDRQQLTAAPPWLERYA
jgi:glycosyltransferase involved in cell wall biosynthesis